jgi:hypothetical protein
VLRPEGRLVIVGFNPASTWGLRQAMGRMLGRMRGPGRAIGNNVAQDSSIEQGRHAAQFLPELREWIGYRRLRDWLRLLGLEVESTRFGCWRLPADNPAWLRRMGWMDALGDRWVPALGALYVLSAVKRVKGLRLVGLARQRRRSGGVVPVALAGAAGRGARQDVWGKGGTDARRDAGRAHD